MGAQRLGKEVAAWLATVLAERGDTLAEGLGETIVPLSGCIDAYGASNLIFTINAVIIWRPPQLRYTAQERAARQLNSDR